jgi:hypothetical protein
MLVLYLLHLQCFGVTVIVPVAFSATSTCQWNSIVECPDTVGVPLIVMVFEANAAVTPAGNPVAVPIPVAPVVAW